MASIPEIKAIEKKLPNQTSHKQVKVEKVKSKKHKGEHHQPLYHGKKRRTSERIKMNSFKIPLIGVGSSQTQPIEIKKVDGDVMTQEDSVKLGTCIMAMKSWKN
jgi:hypothetical protein